MLVISGGPGLPVSYLESLELMAGVGRPVIFYDQVCLCLHSWLPLLHLHECQPGHSMSVTTTGGFGLTMPWQSSDPSIIKALRTCKGTYWKQHDRPSC
jgi:hypothetical protein